MAAKKTDTKQIAKIIRAFSKKTLDDILKIEKKCFPKDWQYEDAKTYYTDSLKNKKNVNTLLFEDKKIVGFALFTPHNSALKEIKKYDPLIKADRNKYYLETIGILPKATGKGGAKKLILKACKEINKGGINHFSIHARTTNGLNDIIKKLFANKILMVRKIKKWYFGGNEPYEYIEWLFINLK